MEISTLLLIILIPLGIFLFIKQQKQKNIKPTAVKKAEIIENYKNQVKKVIMENRHDKQRLIAQKTILLKQINHELSMNLFFTEEESKKIINELLQIS